MTDVIVVRGIRAKGRHGLEATGEREHAQEFVVDVELEVDASKAAQEDSLSSTIDYDEVTRLVQDIIGGESYELVETIADVVANRLLTLGAISATVGVRKPAAERILKVDEVSVTVERPR